MSKPKFSNRIGFVLAAAGSAVGLGNIWRFPYLAAEYGGGIFLLIYLAMLLLFGFPIMTMEIAIGRKTSSASLTAYGELDKRGGFIGILTAVVTLITLPYYCVVGGWVLKYLTVYISGQSSIAGASGFFRLFTSDTAEPVMFQAIFLGFTALILLFGVKNGIERANRIMMPLLIALGIAVAIYTLTLDGAAEGVKYYLTPDLSKLSFHTVLAAMGQMFYSLSLSSGIMVTFGAYIGRSTNIERSVKQIEFFDVGIAFLSGLIVLSAVFALSGGEATATGAGPGLLFETLPKLFSSMPGGFIAGILFFLLVLFAALTSAISMMEVNVANLIDRFHFKRHNAVLLMAGAIFLLGLPSTFGYSLLSNIRPFGMTIMDFFDYIGNSLLTPIVALISCVFIGWVVTPKVLSDEVENSGTFKRRKSFEFIIKWIAPIFIFAILLGSFLEI